MAEAIGRLGTRDRAPIRLLQITALASTLDRFVMPPMLLAVAAGLHSPLGSVAAAAGAYYLAYGLMQPVWGMLSDRLGVVRTMRWSLALAGLATSLSAVAPGLAGLTVTRALAGACFSAAIPSSLVYLGDTVPTEDRQRGVTSLMVATALGTATATARGGLLVSVASWRWAFLGTGVLALGLVWTLRRLPAPAERRSQQRPLALLRRVLTDRTAPLVLGLAFLEGLVLLGVITYLPSAVEHNGSSPAIAGGVTALYGLSVLGSAAVVGTLSRTVAPAGLIAAGAVSALGACSLAAASISPVSAGLACLLLGVAWAAMHSTLQTWATEVVPSARPTAVALFAGSLFAGSAAGAALLAGPANGGNYRLVFLTALALSIPLGVTAGVGRARWQPS